MMAGSHPDIAWRKRRKTLIENLVSSHALDKKLHALSKRTAEERAAGVAILSAELKIPLDCQELLQEYIRTGVWAYELVRPPVSLVSPTYRTLEPSDSPGGTYAILRRLQDQDADGAIYLRIDTAVTRQEIKHFIDTYWQELIKPKLPADGLLAKRIRSKPVAERDKRVAELYSLGHKPRKVAEIINSEFNTALTAEDIRSIYFRSKRNI